MTIPDIIGAIFAGTLALGLLAVLWGGLAWLALTIWIDLRKLWTKRNQDENYL